ncbi:MAG: alpha/beta hydrolase [Tractidigestivibacter sp.]|jgi:acetyl esterase/lipase|uniref:alpha/beta hydrolase n=1 Tax=Tractidigestivibacter sp. TaxID=2847320 RepID=UPI003D94A180
MGYGYEILSTPAAYLKRAQVGAKEAGRSSKAVVIPFGSHRLQHCVLWEPDHVTHDETVMYFHGGGYLVGTPESMINAADVYNSQGYRFCSVGFRIMPANPFPAQVDDAFDGIAAALSWLGEHGRPAERFFVGGSSCGGHLATLVGYGTWLQRAHRLDPARVAGVISVAAITDADDMLLHPLLAPVWPHYISLPAGSSHEERHQALLPYSPIALLDQIPAHAPLPPFFAIHGVADQMSPYAHEVTFVRKLQHMGGTSAARLHTIDDPVWQHMWTTVTLHRNSVEKSAPLTALFAWLDEVTS